jgi:transcriptional regulator
MYLPAHFEESRTEVLHALMRGHPLGLLVTQGPGEPAAVDANALPFHLDPARGTHGMLVAHVARANPVWREARTDTEVLVVFQGPQAYVSPGWYATKAETGKVVPTWNYILVEARGRLVVRDDAAWVHALVSGLTDIHEAGQAQPWKVADAPDDYIAATQRAIVGIEVELTSLRGKWKMSQNRSAADRAGVVRGLAASGHGDVAAWIDPGAGAPA